MTIDWATVAATEHSGASGVARRRTIEAGAARVRMVEYGPGYRADHWCSRGHLLLALEGELFTELQDGRTVTLTTGMSSQVADHVASHRSRTETRREALHRRLGTIEGTCSRGRFG
jgi:hypothetical protein